MKTRRIFLSLLLLMAVSCTKVYNENERDNEPLSPNAPTPIKTTAVVEYRVFGNVPEAEISYSTTNDGLNVVTSRLPWSIRTTADNNSFVHLAATSDFFGTLYLQIYVDGKIFREASTTDATQIISVSGTIRF